ncbi:HEAT repeat domain-containing protein, partial [bacterium]|nr:HEAT repeat domain-containing protein [bacterium]
QSVGISLVVAVIAGLCAGAIGGGISTTLIKILPYFHADAYTIYRNYFILNAGFALFGLVIIMRLKKIKDWEVKQVIGLFFAPRDIRTMMFLNKMNRSLVTLESEKDKIKKLGLLRSGLSEQELLNFMDSPKYELRYHAIWSLINIPLSDNGRQRLINELTDGLFSTANIAAHIIGIRKITEAIPALKIALNSADIRLQGNTMVALTQLKQRESYPAIIEIFNNATNPRLVINGATALTNIGSLEAITAMINKTNQTKLPHQVRREIIIAIAELGGISSEFYKFLKPDDEDTSNELDLFEALSSTSTENSYLHELQPSLDNENSNAEILTLMAKWLNSPCAETPKKVKKEDAKAKHKKTFLNLAALEGPASNSSPKDKLFSAINSFCATAKADQNRELLICLLAICYVRNPLNQQ